MPCKCKVGVTLITTEGEIPSDKFQCKWGSVISREVEAAALKGTRVSSQEISLFTPGPKAATRHHDQADPPYSRRNWSRMHNQTEKLVGHVIDQQDPRFIPLLSGRVWERDYAWRLSTRKLRDREPLMQLVPQEPQASFQVGKPRR